MAKRIKEIGFYINWDTPKIVFQNGWIKEFDTLRVIALSCGPSFAKVPKSLTKKKLDRLVEIGWLKWAHNRWWQVSMKTIFPRSIGSKRHWHNVQMLEIDVRGVLYKMHHDFNQEIQKVPQANVNQRPTKGGRRLNRESRHLGGSAHSIIMKALGISLGYSAKLRRICEAYGIARFTERFTSTKYDTSVEAIVYGEKGFFFDTDCGAWQQLTSEYTATVHWEMSVDRGDYTKGGWRKRRRVCEESIFPITGPYAQ